jgi:hypothetical protein
MRLAEKVREFQFNRAVRAMNGTPPLEPGGEPFTLLSMVHHRDVHAYLLAAKSLARQLRPSQVVVVADPTIDQDDRAILRRHVPSVVIREASEFKHEGLPSYSSWRRLCAIAEYVERGYVIQLDADTVTLGPVPEVAAAMREGAAFVLGTEDGQGFSSCADAAEYARATQLTGIVRPQGWAEAALDRLDVPGIERYVRGCAGFAGYARQSFDVARLRRISDRMAQMLGDKWTQWGTEQFTTLLVVSNTPNARVLPHPKYCMPSVRKPDTSFIHFIGYERFISSLYANVARTIAAELSASGA